MVEKQIYDLQLYSQSWDLEKWKKLGFESRDSAEYWEKSCCGILCINEIASFLNNTTYSTTKLIKVGQKLGAYSHDHGWKHNGLVSLAKKLGLNASGERMSSDDLKQALQERKIPIVSIKWAFNPSKSIKERIFFWKKYGGHLAVVVGYDNEGFYVNHTSKVAKENWKARLIPYAKFKAGYTGRAILIWK